MGWVPIPARSLRAFAGRLSQLATPLFPHPQTGCVHRAQQGPPQKRLGLHLPGANAVQPLIHTRHLHGSAHLILPPLRQRRHCYPWFSDVETEAQRKLTCLRSSLATDGTRTRPLSSTAYGWRGRLGGEAVPSTDCGFWLSQPADRFCPHHPVVPCLRAPAPMTARAKAFAQLWEWLGLSHAPSSKQSAGDPVL